MKPILAYGWHSVSAYFCPSLFIHSVEWLYSLLFSKMERQNVSVASFLGGFFKWYLFFTKVSEDLFSIACNHLVLTELFTSFYMSLDSSGFCLNFHFEGFSYCLQFFGLLLFFYFFLILCFFLRIFWVSPFCTTFVNIDSSALIL